MNASGTVQERFRVFGLQTKKNFKAPLVEMSRNLLFHREKGSFSTPLAQPILIRALTVRTKNFFSRKNTDKVLKNKNTEWTQPHLFIFGI